MPDPVQSLVRRIYREYQKSVDLAPAAHYLYGTPLRPVVPLDSALGGVMVVGAYPSARFGVVDGERDVPLADNLGPFEMERWFDGARVRVQPSARELEELVLQPLGLARARCWITDLVKVFLFKPGHREKYGRLGATVPEGYDREDFEKIAARSLPWLELEIELARPKLIITLGREVAGIVREVQGDQKRNRLLGPPFLPWSIAGDEVVTAHLAHPGILMRPEGKEWKVRHVEDHMPALHDLVRKLAVT